MKGYTTHAASMCVDSKLGARDYIGMLMMRMGNGIHWGQVMKSFRYLEGVSTLRLDVDACTGCGACKTVCPHRVFEIDQKKARIVDRDACMECGACVMNCLTRALSVTPGVGCASYILKTWIKKDKASCGCGEC